MDNEKHSWLEGPQIPAANEDPNNPSRWPGEKLGLPKSGEGALASVLRRCGGIFLDWIMALFLARIVTSFTSAVGDAAFLTMAFYTVIGIVSVWLFARTPGQAIMRMGVARVDKPEERVGLWRAAVRTILTIFLFPPVVVDSDGRGLHDRATGTAVILG